MKVTIYKDIREKYARELNYGNFESLLSCESQHMAFHTMNIMRMIGQMAYDAGKNEGTPGETYNNFYEWIKEAAL